MWWCWMDIRRGRCPIDSIKLSEICKALWEDGIEVEALDEGSAVPHADLVEDV